MMVVVADTTPLRNLARIEYQHILPSLFTRVPIPPAVHGELLHVQTPYIVRTISLPRQGETIAVMDRVAHPAYLKSIMRIRSIGVVILV